MLHAVASTCVSIRVWPPETGNHIPPHLMNFFQMPSVLLQAEWNFAARVKGHLKADGQAGTFSSTASPRPLPAQALRFIYWSTGMWTRKKCITCR